MSGVQHPLPAGVHADFSYACKDCGSTVEVRNSIAQPHDCHRQPEEIRVNITPDVVNRAALAFCVIPESPADACEACRDDALAALRALRAPVL